MKKVKGVSTWNELKNDHDLFTALLDLFHEVSEGKAEIEDGAERAMDVFNIYQQNTKEE